MSHVPLEKQLARLGLVPDRSSSASSSPDSSRRSGPSVPPKPRKAQPQVPRSNPVTLEPSFSTLLTVMGGRPSPEPCDYANIDPYPIYSNVGGYFPPPPQLPQDLPLRGFYSLIIPNYRFLQC